MSETISKVVEFLRINGPSHPVQIGKVLGKDTMMTSAILSEVVSSGRVKMTERKVGNYSLFFLQGQEEKVYEMLKNNLSFIEKKLIERFESRSFIPHSELTTQDKFILPGMRDLLLPLKVKYGDSEVIICKYYNVPNEQIMPSITEMMIKAAPKEVKVSEEKPTERKESIFEKRAPDRVLPKKEAPASGFQTRVESWLSENDIEILKTDVKRKDKEIEYTVKVKLPVEQEYFVKCKEKNRISESDISLAYTEAMQKKMPTIFLTSGKVSKKILAIVEKKFGGLVRVVGI
jgi:hypothetical protein